MTPGKNGTISGTWPAAVMDTRAVPLLTIMRPSVSSTCSIVVYKPWPRAGSGTDDTRYSRARTIASRSVAGAWLPESRKDRLIPRPCPRSRPGLDRCDPAASHAAFGRPDP